MGIEVDHSGEKYGRLTLLRKGEPYKAPKTGKKKQRYYCSCDCGKYTENNPKLIVYEAIKSGLIESCGCSRSEKLSKRNKNNKKYNKYDLSGKYGIGYTYNGDEFYFDLEDYDKIKDYCWQKDDSGYIRTSINHKTVGMHRIVMGLSDKRSHVDHKHGKQTRNDNRKSNLRIATCSQNQMNRGLQSNNTSGVTGVIFNKKSNKWEAYITANKKRICLGSFIDFDNAVNARKLAEETYFGEWSYDNSMNGIDYYESVS